MFNIYSWLKQSAKKYIHISLRDTLISIGIFAIAFLLCFILQPFSENDFHVPLIFILVVIIISRMTDGYLYGLLASIAGVISVNYIFTYPYFELDFTLTGYPLTFATMLIVSIVTCTMTARIKTQEHFIKESEKEKIRADLLRGISHDVRTPLTGIAGAANVLLEDSSLTQYQRRELLKDIENDSSQLIHMIENVLSITRIGDAPDNITKEAQIAEEILSAAILKFKRQWPDIIININIPKDIIFVYVDAMLIEQVIQNILHNSVIHGSCSRIEIYVKKIDDFALFSFHDNGTGFLTQKHGSSKINPVSAYVQGNADKQKNMGIGLSVCRTIINAHNGDLILNNAPDGGALVEFKLPLYS